MKKVFLSLVIAAMAVVSVNAQKGDDSMAQLQAFLNKYKQVENANVTFIPKGLFMMLDDNGLSDDLLSEIKRMDYLTALLYNKDAGDMTVYSNLAKEVDAILNQNGYISMKNTNANGVLTKVLVKMGKGNKTENVCIIIDRHDMFDAFLFTGDFNVAKIPTLVKQSNLLEKIAKKM